MPDENAATAHDENVESAESTDVTATEDENTEVTETEGDEAPDTEELGDKGQRALERMKEDKKALKRELRAARQELEDLKASSARPNDEPTADDIRREAEKAANERANQRILKAEVKSAAAGKLSDPSDAFRFLDLSDFEVDADGNVDADEIADAISDLLTKRPYLSASDNRFKGRVDQGTRKAATGPTQLTRDDLSRMTAEEIVAAEKAGQLNRLQGRK